MRREEEYLDRRLSLDAAKAVKMTAPAFKVYGREIAESTYDRLIANPEARAIFGEHCYSNGVGSPTCSRKPSMRLQAKSTRLMM